MRRLRESNSWRLATASLLPHYTNLIKFLVVSESDSRLLRDSSPHHTKASDRNWKLCIDKWVYRLQFFEKKLTIGHEFEFWFHKNLFFIYLWFLLMKSFLLSLLLRLILGNLCILFLSHNVILPKVSFIVHFIRLLLIIIKRTPESNHIKCQTKT